MAIQLKAGARLRSAIDACEVVVVRRPPTRSTCAAAAIPSWRPTPSPRPESIDAGFEGGTQLGKRYSDDELGLELLCTKAGEGAISVGDTVLAVKGAKPLPASD